MGSIRIGELLIREGLITAAELEEALKAQVIFGGRLGTNLIEMGLLEEDDIAKVLSRKLKVPFVKSEQMVNIPPQIIALVPRELAERHKVLPLRLENRRLTLAMATPADLRAIDEIAFQTGFIVQPVVAAEVRLLHALEQHYQIARELRYVAVHRQPGGRRNGAPPPSPPRPPPLPEVVPAPEEFYDLDEIGEQMLAAAALKTRAASTLAPAAPPEPVLELEEVVPEPPPLALLDLEEVARRLAHAESREDIADLAIQWAAPRFGRSALFLIRQQNASGWRGSADGRPMDDFAQLRIPLSEPSVFKTVTETRSWHLGPLPRTPFNSQFLQELGGEVPATVLLMPLLMMGRVIAILYVDGPASALQEHLHALQKLAAKMVMAFEVLILKNKIAML